MVSLADERYVDEMLEERIVLHGRKKSTFPVFAASAAATVLVLGGIWHFANTAGLSPEDDIPVTHSAADTVFTAAEETEQDFDYEKLFKNKYSGDFPLYFQVYNAKTDNKGALAFDMEYALSVLPFKAEGFTGKRSQFYLYPDENGESISGTIYLESNFDENASPKFRNIRICMGRDGTLSHSFPIEDTVPANRFGTELFCYEDTAAYLSDVYSSNLKAYFVIGDMEYAVETCNISAAETGEIIDSIIESGLSPDSFDISRAYGFEHNTSDISFDRANATEPFTGYVPVVDGILYLYSDSVIYDVQIVNGKVTGQYMVVVYTDNTADGERIRFDYYTNGYFGKEPFENTVDLYDIATEGLDAFITDGEYKFTADCGKFMINVTAKCPADMLMTYIDAIRGGTSSEQDGVRMSNGINLVDTTLSAADKIKPFAGYVPQSESFGSLKLSAVSEGYFDGDALPSLLHLVYADDLENPRKMMTAHFYSDYKAVFLDEPKYSAVPLAELSLEKIESLEKSFVADCGDFEILIGASRECSAEDIWGFINEVKGLVTYDAEDEDEKILTIDKVKELAQKGDDLMWDDFDGYTFTEGGSELYIKSYAVEGGYNLMICGEGRETKPMYIYLSDGKEKRIDIRYDSIDEFLS